MAIKTLISQESQELEVERYLERELQEDSSDEYDNLYANIKDDINKENEKDDLEEDLPEDDSSAAIEALRDLRYSVATEELSDVGTSLNVILAAGLVLIRDCMKALAELGLHYGPPLLSKLYKGIIFAITKLATGLVSSIVAINDYRVRNNETFDKFRSDISKLKKSLDLIDKPKDVSELIYSNQKVINSLKISDNVELKSNISVLKEFLEYIINSISIGVDKDIDAIKHIIGYAVNGIVKEPNDLMTNSIMPSKLTEKSFEGYQEESELLVSYGYDKALPGDINFIAYLPTSNLDNIDSITKAYNQSNMFLGFDNESFKSIESIPYLDKEGLKSFLDELDALCEVAAHHVYFYNHIEEKKKSLKYSFRLYISAIVNSNVKMTSKMSLIDYVSLKAMFIDKVYLAAAMDIHDYVIKVVSSGMLYAKDNVIKLS